jgi:hypothetical protein
VRFVSCWKQPLRLRCHEADLANIKQQFYEIGQRGRLHWGFPNVLAVMDCTHVLLQKPREYPEQYVDRFFHHSSVSLWTRFKNI